VMRAFVQSGKSHSLKGFYICRQEMNPVLLV
jgi:hypothetical protein